MVGRDSSSSRRDRLFVRQINSMELDNLLLLRGLLLRHFFVVGRAKVKHTIKLGANLILIAIHKWINKWLFDLQLAADYSHVLFAGDLWVRFEGEVVYFHGNHSTRTFLHSPRIAQKTCRTLFTGFSLHWELSKDKFQHVVPCIFIPLSKRQPLS